MQRYHGSLLALGLAGVGLLNQRFWQRDRVLAQELRNQDQRVPALRRTPLVSVLVAAWNEQEYIDAHIQSFLALRYPQIELIICAGGSDETLARARGFAGPRLQVLEQQSGEGKQRALVRCLEHATGAIVYLTDADCLFDETALVQVLAPLINEGEQVTTGRTRPLDRQGGKILPRYLAAADSMVSARHPRYSGGLLGRNAAMTRAALEQAGGMDFAAPTGTDYHLARRLIQAGFAIRYVPASVVATAYPETLAGYRRMQSRWLRNLIMYGGAYGARRDVWMTGRTIATGALMVSAPLAAPFLGRWLLLPWSLLLAQAVAAKVRYTLFAARLADQSVPLRLLAALPLLALADFAIWALPILDLLSARKRKQW